jgi:hypothetical protein
MRAEDAVEFLKTALEDAQQAIGRDGAFNTVYMGEPNVQGGKAIEIIFNNDDMERPEMRGRIIIDTEEPYY